MLDCIGNEIKLGARLVNRLNVRCKLVLIKDGCYTFKSENNKFEMGAELIFWAGWVLVK